MKKPAVWLAFALFLFTACLLIYRIVGLGYPLIPAISGQTWQLAIDAYIHTDGPETKVALGLPIDRQDQILIEEKLSLGDMNVTIHREGQDRIGIWSETGTAAEERLVAYRALIHLRPRRALAVDRPVLGAYPTSVKGEAQILAELLVAGWKDLPPHGKIQAIVATAKGRWVHPPPSDAELRKWIAFKEKMGPHIALLTLFRAADLPARSMEGVALVERVTNHPLRWIEVWNGQNWERLRADSGDIYDRRSLLLPLVSGERSVITVAGGELKDIRFVLNREIVSNWRLQFERIRRSESFLDRWSLFRLPEEFQRTFRILLLVPVGALMISALRNLVGFPTFGIFMPVLMALAFRNTGILYGLGIFFGVVFIGYAVRRVLEKMRLLLVPRMSVLLTLVIGSFTILALVGSKLGIREFMAVGLLPFVILTMVIERFFLLVEEAGISTGMRTALGSALVAAITYFMISWEPLQLTFFLYPELLLAVSALQILVGQYSGYRLMELFRFRKLIGSP